MRCENNRKLIAESGSEDVVVASDMSAMMLAQVAEDPRRLGLFNELLDEQGCEVYLKPLADFGISETKMTVREFRSNIYAYGYTPLGIRTRVLSKCWTTMFPSSPRAGTVWCSSARNKLFEDYNFCMFLRAVVSINDSLFSWFTSLAPGS